MAAGLYHNKLAYIQTETSADPTYEGITSLSSMAAVGETALAGYVAAAYHALPARTLQDLNRVMDKLDSSCWSASPSWRVRNSS